MNMNEDQYNLLKALVKDIVTQNYTAIDNDGRIGRLTVSEFEKAIKEYPGKLTLPPDEAYQHLHYYPRKQKSDEEGIVEFELWFDEKESDLTLSATFIKKRGTWRIRIDDLHVL